MGIRKICIVGLEDYPLLSGEQDRSYVGGESVQRVLLARAWRDLGLEVSMIVHDHGQGARREFDGITAIAAHGSQSGMPVLRFVHPRMTRLLGALLAADADVYYQSCAGVHTGLTAWLCRSTGKRFVFRVASNADCTPGEQLIRHWRDRKLFEYGLRRADLVVAQTAHQMTLLRDHYCLPSALVNMAVEVPPPREEGLKRDIDVLWLSNLQPLKRPELALELARGLPQVRFTLAGGPAGAQAYYDDVLEAAARLRNVTLLGPVRYADTGRLFERTRIFLNTSSIEGFPNTFLQAWIRGVPTITFFDPDGLVQSKRLGWVATSLDDMRASIRSMLDDEPGREAMGQRARLFVKSDFTPASAASRYLELLEAAAQPRLRFGTAD